MQQEDQKLLVLLEKEIFDIRQAMHYLDEGHIASVKEVAKTLLIDTENATNITRLLATALHQTTLLIDEDRRGYEKMNNALDMLKKEIETVVKQVADTKINMQREEKGIRNYQEQLEKIYKDTQESAELVHTIIEAIKKLDHHVSMLDDSLKRFSW